MIKTLLHVKNLEDKITMMNTTSIQTQTRLLAMKKYVYQNNKIRISVNNQLEKENKEPQTKL